MGFLNNLLGGGDTADDAAEEFVDEVDGMMEESEEELEVDDEWEEGEDMTEEEWDSAYRFAEEFLEVYGFTGMQDFTTKAMMMQIEQSPRYRDRIESGVKTLNMISSAQSQLQAINGEDNSDANYTKQAEKLRAANEVMDQVDKLDGKEEEWAQQFLSLGYEAVDKFAAGGGIESANGNIDSEMVEREGEL